jgi:DNA-binding transcriptional ArsR family regulator
MVVKPAARKRRRHGDLDAEQLRAVADLFAVLSEPTRLRILQVLQRDGAATVGRITAAAQIKQANASKQLGILHQAGVLALE